MDNVIKPLNSKGKKKPDLIAVDDSVHQKTLYDKGIKFVEFGSGPNNQMPANPVKALDTGTPEVKRHLSQQFQNMTSNVSAAVDYAKSIGKLDEWANWYNTAHELASHLSKKYNVSHLQASGVIAATSTGGSEWSVNQRNAEAIIQHHKEGRNPLNHKDYQHVTGEQVLNATRILNGEHPDDVLGAVKGGTFAQNIHDPEKNANKVTVDTQMHFLMEGWKRPWASGGGGGAPNLATPGVDSAGNRRPHHRFNFMGKYIVSEAASEHGLTPMEGQAVAWMAFKHLTPGTPGTPPPTHPNFAEHYDINDLRIPERFRKLHFENGSEEAK